MGRLVVAAHATWQPAGGASQIQPSPRPLSCGAIGDRAPTCQAVTVRDQVRVRRTHACRNSFCVHLTELSVSSLDSFCWNEVADRPNQIRLPEFSSRRFSCSCEDTGSLKLGDPHCKCTFRYEAFDCALWGTMETPALVLILHCKVSRAV